jgi:hypothetical protein
VGSLGNGSPFVWDPTEPPVSSLLDYYEEREGMLEVKSRWTIHEYSVTLCDLVSSLERLRIGRQEIDAVKTLKATKVGPLAWRIRWKDYRNDGTSSLIELVEKSNALLYCHGSMPC